jgi:tetratricopeptide (TPR) repeat protein
MIQAGNSHGELGNHQSALEAYASALQKDPGDAWIYASRAYLLASMGQPEAALEDVNLALRHSPDYAWAHSHRGALLLQLHRPQTALTSLNQALELLQSDQEQAGGCQGLRPYTHLLRARSHQQLGDLQAAEDDYHQAIHLYRRYRLRDLQDYQRALAELQHLQEQQAIPAIL